MLFTKAIGDIPSSALLPQLAPKLICDKEEGRLSDEPILTLRCRPRYDVLAGEPAAGDMPVGHGSSDVPLKDRCPTVGYTPPDKLALCANGDKPEVGSGLVASE